MVALFLDGQRPVSLTLGREDGSCMHRNCCETPLSRSRCIFAVSTKLNPPGDGNRGRLGDGFLQDVERAVARGGGKRIENMKDLMWCPRLHTCQSTKNCRDGQINRSIIFLYNAKSYQISNKYSIRLKLDCLTFLDT